MHSQAATTSAFPGDARSVSTAAGTDPPYVRSAAVRPSNGHHLRWVEDVEPNLVLGENIHLAPTKIVSLEVCLLLRSRLRTSSELTSSSLTNPKNTLNGQIFPQDEIVKISENVKKEGIIMHLDGARCS